MVTRCILKENCGCGMNMFWKEPCKSDDEEFNREYTRIYDGTDVNRLIAILHVSRTIDIPDNVKVVKQRVCFFPEDSWLDQVWETWSERKMKA